MSTIQFLGATETVTGSRFVLEVEGSRALIDCGLFQGLKELRARNWDPFPIKPASLSWVLLTHAHIDHSGYLPRLVRDGFTGPVFATTATADLLKILLPDSARLQEEDADYVNRKGFTVHQPALPLYTEEDAKTALKHIRTVSYKKDVRLNKYVQVKFISAGHILGSSFLMINISEPDKKPIKVLFSGDLGRYDEPILNDPSQIDEADYLVLDSTYGNRLHDNTDPKIKLAEIINSTAEKGGKLIIPAFSVGRTQLLVYYIRELEDEGRIPILPVIVDSPMSSSATRVYLEHKEEHDRDMQRIEAKHKNALATRNFSLVQGRAGSKAVNTLKGTAIIISASGMATGGRVLHHLAKYLPDPATTVLFVGYQAIGTRGRHLEDGQTETKIHGEIIPVQARIESLHNLSAHADWSEILKWLSLFKRPPGTTFLVHGEPDSTESLKQKIVEKFGWNVEIPGFKQIYDLV